MNLNTICLAIIIFISHLSSAQQVDWLETVIIEQFTNQTILVRELDSIKMHCTEGRRKAYCSSAEALFDSKIIDLRQEQAELVANFGDGIELTDNPYGNLKKTKVRYLIDYDFDLMNLSKKRSSLYYLKFDFIIIDLETTEIVARARAQNLNTPFAGLQEVLLYLKEFQAESF